MPRPKSAALKIGPMSDQLTEYQRRIVETLALAKYARTEEERAYFFTTAEEWSAKARDAEVRQQIQID